MSVPCCFPIDEFCLLSSDLCAQGIELPEDRLPSCVEFTMSSKELNEPCWEVLAAGDYAAGLMGLNVELGLLEAKPDVVGTDDCKMGYIPGQHICLSMMSTSVEILQTASFASNSSGNCSTSS